MEIIDRNINNILHLGDNDKYRRRVNNKLCVPLLRLFSLLGAPPPCCLVVSGMLLLVGSR
jgi:hypothetical protein